MTATARSGPETRPFAPSQGRTRDRRHGSQAWRRRAQTVLRRDGYRCMVVPGCPTPASMADHIVAVYPGMTHDLFYGMGNLRAACRFHNSARGIAARLEREQAQPSAVVSRDYTRRDDV